MKVTMYNILEEHRELLGSLEQLEGELTPDLDELLKLNKDQFEDKAVSYGYMIKHFEDQSEAVAKEIKRLQGLKKKSDTSAEYLRDRLSLGMTEFDYEKIEKNNLKLSWRKSEAVEIDDITILPADYLVQQDPTPDKAAIKTAIKNGEFVRGASIVERRSLQIK